MGKKGEPQGVSPAQNTESLLQRGDQAPLVIVPGEDIPLGSDRMGNSGLPVPRPVSRQGVGI